MIAKILSVYWVIGSQFWACKSRRQSSLDCWHPETYALSTPSMNHFCLWCSEVNCWQEEIHKFKTEVLEYLDKYQVLWPSSTSKYQVLLNFKRSSTSKYQVLDNSHQVPSTSTLLDPNPVRYWVHDPCSPGVQTRPRPVYRVNFPSSVAAILILEALFLVPRGTKIQADPDIGLSCGIQLGLDLVT